MQKGVSLIETILVVVVIGFIVLLMDNLPNALGLITKSSHLSLAKEIAAKQIEDKRAIGYTNLANGATTILDSRLSILPGGSGQVITEDCNAQICTNTEHVKHIQVTVSWKDNNKNQSTTLDTFVGEGGLQ